MAFPNTLFLICTLICIYGAIVNVTWAQVYVDDDDPVERAMVASILCTKVGEKHVHSADCGSYFECALINGIWQLIPKTCYPPGAMFDDDPEVKACVDLFGYCPNKPPDFPQISKCQNLDDKFVSEKDCGQYFRCHDYRGTFYPEVLQCPGSQKFDDSPAVKQCVDGECPQILIPLPEGPGWHCSEIGDFNVLPTDCSKFYKCMRCSKNPGGWCYKELDCGEGSTFDDTLKACVAGPCPQTLKELPGGPGWNCEDTGDLNVHPEDCTEYYECFRCSKPRGWCYVDMSCPADQFFDDVLEKCVESEKCPQDLTPKPPSWECAGGNELVVNPEHCNMYYRCVKCSKPEAKGQCVITYTCPDGKMFDDNIDKCVDGVCPGDLTPVNPKVHQCNVPGEKNVFKHDCSKYYECHKCSHGPKGWCFLPQTCPDGENFDETTEQCVASPCPQGLAEMPSKGGFYCQHNGQTNVHPSDCTKWYVCYQCSKPRGWCVVYEQCPAGQWFEDVTDTCGKYGGCCPNGRGKNEPCYVDKPTYYKLECEKYGIHGLKLTDKDKKCNYWFCDCWASKCTATYHTCWSTDTCFDYEKQCCWIFDNGGFPLRCAK